MAPSDIYQIKGRPLFQNFLILALTGRHTAPPGTLVISDLFVSCNQTCCNLCKIWGLLSGQFWFLQCVSRSHLQEKVFGSYHCMQKRAEGPPTDDRQVADFVTKYFIWWYKQEQFFACATRLPAVPAYSSGAVVANSVAPISALLAASISLHVCAMILRWRLAEVCIPVQPSATSACGTVEVCTPSFPGLTRLMVILS